jgi:hypothetical protein
VLVTVLVTVLGAPVKPAEESGWESNPGKGEPAGREAESCAAGATRGRSVDRHCNGPGE